MAVELVIAAWLVPAAIDRLSGLVQSYILDQFHYPREVMESLQRGLREIMMVIDDAESKGIKEVEDPNLVSWLYEVKDAADEAEDYLALHDSGIKVNRKFVRNVQTVVKKLQVLSHDGRLHYLE